MKLMLVLESWGTGGTEQYVDTLYRAFRRFQPETRISVVLLDGDVPSLDWADEIKNIRIRSESGRQKFIQDHGAENPDICHLHLYTSTLQVTKLVGRQPSVRVISTFHSPIAQWNWVHRIKLKRAATKCDAIVGASDFTTEQLRHWRTDAVSASPPIEVISTEPRAQADSVTDDFLVCGLGRLAIEKNWGILIDAVAAIDGERTARIDLIGSGSLRTQLQSQVESLGASSRINFRGKLPHKKALEAVARANLFVLPSLYEGFGMAAVEAMMLGVPVITSDFPASAEYIQDGVTGHRFPIGDHQRLAELIQWHMNHPEESRQIGLNGQKFAREHYQPERIAKLHLDLYERLLD